MFGLTIPLFIQIVLVLFACSAILQLFYNLGIYSRISSGRKKKHQAENTRLPVSVVICARNEAENLQRYLPSILGQDWPEFEVIVVNDCSEDDTEDVLNLLTQKYSNLRIATIHKDSSLVHSKKMALFIGIKAARNEILLLTDADCQPVSSKWIELMTQGLSGKAEFILGYGGYMVKKGLLNRYIRYDTMFIAMQYMGMTLAGMPYMGVGRNLAYKRSLFFKNRGFGAHINLQSGDDDLFVNSLANRNNCYTQLDPDSFTRSVPATSFSSFSKQKMRHMSTSVYYRLATRILLMAEPLSRLTFWVTAIILISGIHLLPLVLPLFGATFLSRIIVLYFAQNALNERDLLLFSPLFDIASPVLNAIFLLGSRLNKHQNYEWK